MRFVVLVCSLALLAACSDVSVKTDFLPGADFSHIKTYAWIKQPTTTNPLLAERIVNDINLQLERCGWKNVDSHESADAALSAMITTKEREHIDTMNNGMGYGYGYGWRGMGGGGMGMSTSTVYHETIGTLHVDIFDTKSKNSIWYGSASGTVTNDPGTDTKKARDAIVEMFKKFPPDSTAVKK